MEIQKFLVTGFHILTRVDLFKGKGFELESFCKLLTSECGNSSFKNLMVRGTARDLRSEVQILGNLSEKFLFGS